MLTIHKNLDLDSAMELKGLFETSRRFCKTKQFTEVGKTGHLHTHSIFQFEKRVNLSSKKMWDNVRQLVGNFDLKPISSDEHMANCCKYDKAKKKGGEDSDSQLLVDEIGEFKAQVPYHIRCIEFIQAQTSFIDCLKDPEFGEYIAKGKLNWARYIFSTKPSEDMTLQKLFDWQRYFDTLCTLDPDDRTVHWVTDIKGGRGKSALLNHLISKYNAFAIDDGAGKDIAYAYSGQPVVLIDLCRDNEDWVPYRVIEKFKNKRMFSAKYESHLKTFKAPHIIVFANFSPDKTRLTSDRWIEYHLM